MVRVKPPSPPSSNPDKMYQNGFHQLAQHSANTSYPRPSVEYDDRSVSMKPQSAYAPPGPEYRDDGYRYGNQLPPYGYQGQHHGSGMIMPYENYAQDMDHYGRTRFATPQRSLPVSPSITPRDEPIRTRSGLTINRSTQPLKALPQSKSRVPKSLVPKSKKANKAKKENTVAKLEKPLSELTKDWTHVPVVDIEAYVNRSAEERKKEVETGKQPGRVKRPMNSFMLYRKAYQNRTKNWCLQNNHQVVSQVCGDSWPLEPQAVRDQYNEWARIERNNHQIAHPGYKFSPSKAVISKSVKRKASEGTEDNEESDLEDWDWKTGRRTPKQMKRETKQRPNSGYDSRSPFQYSREVSEEPAYHNYNRSSYQANNPGRPPPMQYSQINLRPGHYYETTMRPTPGIHGAEDVMTSIRPVPGIHNPGLVGHDYAVMDPYYQEMEPDSRIDPNLVAHDEAMYNGGMHGHDGMYMADINDPQWHTSAFSILGQDLDHDTLNMIEGPQDLQIHDQHLQMLKESNQDTWQVESLDEGQEFDKWMD